MVSLAGIVRAVRDGVVAARMEGVAAADAAGGQPAAAQRAMPLDRLHRVFRTAGHEPATRPQHGTDEALVKAQHHDEQACDHRRMIPATP